LAVSFDGLAALGGVGGIDTEARTTSKHKRHDPDDEEAYPAFANDADPWKAHFAEIDAVLDRTTRVLAGETPLPKSRSHLVYDMSETRYVGEVGLDAGPRFYKSLDTQKHVFCNVLERCTEARFSRSTV
jgi:Tat protein secretion system quality control protein TatD with DNase activity